MHPNKKIYIVFRQNIVQRFSPRIFDLEQRMTMVIIPCGNLQNPLRMTLDRSKMSVYCQELAITVAREISCFGGRQLKESQGMKVFSLYCSRF